MQMYKPKIKDEIEQVIHVFQDYIRATPHFDVLWSDKVGYIYLTVDAHRRTVADSDSWVIESAEDLFDKLVFEIAIDVLEEGGHTYDPREASRLERDAVENHLKQYTLQLPEFEDRIPLIFTRTET